MIASGKIPLENILKDRFGLLEFRRGQKEIISSVLGSQDAIAVLPTGGGKSLCYQYPAVAQKKLVVVVSPLIALMKDQVMSLSRAGIPAGCLHSGQSEDEKRDVFRRMALGGPFLLYLSPERVQKEGFQNWVLDKPIALFAVDEAHCVSQWGHDFREEYSQLKVLKKLRPDVPVLALTASATPFVLNDIAKQLDLKKPIRHVHGFYRPNLYYQVEVCAGDEEKMVVLKRALQQFTDGRVLIYCGTRHVTEELSHTLSYDFAGVDYYHAGLSAKERHQKQEDYAEGRSRILVATNAFGMGIDHPDVRLVVHFQMPANIDSLYQEMGRGGRDGAASTCVMLYSKKDKGLQSFFIQKSRASSAVQSTRWRALENLVDYAEGSECRHAEILTYYHDSQRIDRCGHCDVCDPESLRRVRVPQSSRKSSSSEPPSKTRLRRLKTEAQNQELNSDQMRLFEILKIWRKDKAKELDVPAFIIMSDKTLRHMAKVKPRTMGELMGIYGLGDVKVEKFGEELLQGPLA